MPLCLRAITYSECISVIGGGSKIIRAKTSFCSARPQKMMFNQVECSIARKKASYDSRNLHSRPSSSSAGKYYLCGPQIHLRNQLTPPPRGDFCHRAACQKGFGSRTRASVIGSTLLGNYCKTEARIVVLLGCNVWGIVRGSNFDTFG